MGQVVFAADDGVHGRELWVAESDGSGAILLTDLNPGTASSSPDSLTVVNGRVVFIATTAGGGREIWSASYDAPPVQLMDIVAGTGSSNPVILAEASGKVFFTANNATVGRELYVTDGTVAGTSLVKDVRPGASPSGISYVGKVGEHIVFLAGDGVTGREMWASDGTAAGTVLLADANPGSGSLTVSFNSQTQQAYVQTREIDGKLQYYAGIGSTFSWWETDGTVAGTHKLDAPDLSPVSNRTHLVEINGKTYFVGNDGSGWSPWVTDGTPAGTVKLTTATASNAFGANFTVAGGKVVFVATDAAHGTELWVTDGTPAGTQLLKEIVPDVYSTAILEIESYGTKALFGARLPDNNWGIWITDGTTAGTTLLKTLSNFNGSPFVPVGEVDGRFLFKVSQNNTEQLWSTNGTASGTLQLAGYVGNTGAPLFRNDLPADFIKVGEHYVYTAGNATGGRELWTTDGTVAGTHMLFDSMAGVLSGEFGNFRLVDGVLYFSARTLATGVELWSTDGTSAGTRLVSDIAAAPDLTPGTAVGEVFDSFNGGGLFHVETEEGTYQLWFSNGSAAGTVMLTENDPFDYSGVQAGGKYYFIASIPGHGLEVWVTDGTLAGTRVTREIGAGALNGVRGDVNPVAFGDKVLIAGGANGNELWVSDGTDAGTIKLLSAANELERIMVFGGRAFVETSVSDVSHLWTTDGTPGGTVDLGIASDSWSNNHLYDDMIQVGDLWIYVGLDATGMSEPWVTDGTLAGTRLLKDINVGDASFPNQFATLNGKVYFPASDGLGGADLWVSDGTTAGTAKLTSVLDGHAVRVLGLSGTNGREIQTLADGRVLFVESAPGFSQTLWATDGTAEGATAIGEVPIPANWVDAYFENGQPLVIVGARDGRTYAFGTDGAANSLVQLPVPNLNGFTGLPPKVLGDEWLLIGNDEQGRGLWATDGTADGTHKIAPAGPTAMALLAVLGDTAIFGGDGQTSTNDQELWLYSKDAGAIRVDLAPGDAGSYPISLTEFGGAVYFAALTGGDHYELWKTDGTVAGTVRASTLNLGGPNENVILALIDGRLAFMADDGVNGFELWSSDGTSFTRLTNAVAPSDSDPGPVTQLPSPPPPPTINGNARSEIINGTSVGEVINALGGNDVVNGLAGDDTLNGGDGADQLFGGAGIDTLVGGAGNDTLDGGDGADVLRGGVGSDVYKVGAGDTIEELAGEGTDTVEASVSFTLSDNVENLKLITTRNIDGFGNDLNNQLTGNNYNNRLEGGGGVDTIDGLNGDDIILGGAGGDIIQAGNGADVITGGTGNDTLRGGSGADRFVVLQESMGVSETDTIRDFYTSQGDVMDLSGIDANALVDGDQAFTLVSTFSKQAGQMTLTWLPGQATTLLKLDVNGDGRLDYQLKINGNVTADSGTWML